MICEGRNKDEIFKRLSGDPMIESNDVVGVPCILNQGECTFYKSCEKPHLHDKKPRPHDEKPHPQDEKPRSQDAQLVERTPLVNMIETML